jgi:hypothetical protein
MVNDKVVCEACTRAYFGSCEEHQQPAFDCGCAELQGPSTYAAGQAAIEAADNRDGTRTCGACGATFRSKVLWMGSAPSDDPIYSEPPLIYFPRERAGTSPSG